MKKILIVVDYQNDFVNPNGALPVPNAFNVASNIQRRIDSDEYSDIIYTFDTHTVSEYKNSDEAKMFPNIHCEFGTKGWELFPEIKPKFKEYFNMNKSNVKPFTSMTVGNEHFFTKNIFDIWEGNDTYKKWFVSFFSSDEVEVDVVGVASEVCVNMNILGLVERGYKVNFIENCCMGITDEGTIEAIERFKDLDVGFKVL